MNRKVLQRVAASAITCVAAGLVPLLGATHALAASSPAIAVSHVNLSAGYTSLLAREKIEPRAITFAKGHHKMAAAGIASASCVEPRCPLAYGGGKVQHAPAVYLLLWGTHWSTTGPDATYLNSFLSGLGTQPQDKWSTTTDQYNDSTGQPAFSGSVFRGVYQDSTTPPHGATQTQLGAEADAFYSAHAITDTIDTQIVIATQSGTCPEGFAGQAGSICGSGQYCAWHSYSSVHRVPYTNLPYLPDAGSACGANSVNSAGPYDGFSIVEGHEYAETITDPQPNSGWYDPNDSSGGEIGDKCAWTGMADVTLSTGSFPMQPLWSNGASACVLSTLIVITTTGLPTGVLGHVYDATVTAAAGTRPFVWSRISGTKPPGLSFSTTGVWTGTPTTAGTYSFTLRVTDNLGASATRALKITTAAFGITTNSFHSATAGVAYTATATAAGGTSPYVWSRTSGTKPPGLSFSASGIWRGTPTAAGTYSFDLQATDHSGRKATRVLSITITTPAVTTT